MTYRNLKGYEQTTIHNNNVQITAEDIEKRTWLRKKLNNSEIFPEKPKMKSGAVGTDERKDRRRERMEEVWEEMKVDVKKQLKPT